jgi:hypothetical protein
MNARTRTGTALLALALNLPLWTTGCGTMTTDLSTIRSGPGVASRKGAFEAGIFDRERDISKNVYTANRVASELYRQDAKGSVLVTRTTEPFFEATGLEPGKYRLTVYGWRDGNASESPSATRHKTFTVAPGPRVRADVVLNDYGAAITGGSAVLIGIGVILVISAVSALGGGLGGLQTTAVAHHREPAPCAPDSKIACESR